MSDTGIDYVKELPAETLDQKRQFFSEPCAWLARR
jgi:hypothetical protein